jgi:hypothetical protein
MEQVVVAVVAVVSGAFMTSVETGVWAVATEVKAA